MADIASSDVSYSLSQREMLIQDKNKQINVNVSFGDGALTYPAGGVPLDKSKIGFRSEISDLILNDASSGDGYVYKFDKSNEKIRIYQGNNDGVADGPLVELSGGVDAPAATTLKCLAIGF